MSFETESAQGLALLLWAADADEPHRLVTPFLLASAAAAMEMQVEVYFTARSVRLLVPGTADALRAEPGAARTIADVMLEAHEHGARFMACSEALRAQDLVDRPLIKAYDGRGGMVQFLGRTVDPLWRTLVF